MLPQLLVAGLLGLAAAAPAADVPGEMARVGPGVLHRAYASAPGLAAVDVAAFALDRLPTTNAEFLEFLAEHPRWRRDRVPRLLAADEYLGHWAGPLDLGPAAPTDRPVTRISWFAAKAYCAAQGK